MLKLTRFLDKGRQVLDLTKMGVKIEKEEENLEKLYTNLGRVFYKVHGESPEIMYDDLFRTVAGAELQLAHLRKEYDLIRNRGKCQGCETDMKPADAYCPSCGEAVDKVEIELPKIPKFSGS